MASTIAKGDIKPYSAPCFLQSTQRLESTTSFERYGASKYGKSNDGNLVELNASSTSLPLHEKEKKKTHTNHVSFSSKPPDSSISSTFPTPHWNGGRNINTSSRCLLWKDVLFTFYLILQQVDDVIKKILISIIGTLVTQFPVSVYKDLLWSIIGSQQDYDMSLLKQVPSKINKTSHYEEIFSSPAYTISAGNDETNDDWGHFTDFVDDFTN